jgi:hypothetical protein
MRPIKDIIAEEYWNIGFRLCPEEDSVVLGNGKFTFKQLETDKRFWYADPFLFEKDGKTYLFVEMFDNKKERGVIGCSEYENGGFKKPRVVLCESFHLSYPYVFEKDGDIYMMPETHEDGCIKTYKAVLFPYRWEQDDILVKDVNAVDTVIENGLLITSLVCPQNDMSVDLCVFDAGTGVQCGCSPVFTDSKTKRGAGKCFDFNGKRIRPSQSCVNGGYGERLLFNEIKKCTESEYCETEFSEITPENIETESKLTPCGVHTYARCGNIECVDMKFRRFNLPRLFWIADNKIKRSV